MSTDEDIKNVVIARLETFPHNRKISVGSSGEFTPDEMVTHVKKGDKIGKMFVEIEIEFLRALKEGLIS